MGKDVETTEFSREDRMRYRDKVRQCLDAFARMLADAHFEDGDGMSGLEIELNLVDEQARPRACATSEVLDAIADPRFQTELGQFNIEINVPPRRLAGDGLAKLEDQLRASLNAAERARARASTRGIVDDRHPAHPAPRPLPPTSCPPTRATRCSTSRSWPPAARTCSSTSTGSSGCDHAGLDRAGGRLHQRAVPPAGRPGRSSPRTGTPPRRSRACRSRSAPTRPSSSAASCGARPASRCSSRPPTPAPEELKAQGVRPRIWFGERWITSIFDLFEENVRYFPPLLPICEDEDPSGPRRRRRAEARRAAAAQRHRLPLEPPGLRRRGRPPAPAGREPGAARRPDRRRHAGQRRLLLRAGPRARRGGPAGLDASCPSAPPRRTSTPPPGTASTRPSSGPASARSP